MNGLKMLLAIGIIAAAGHAQAGAVVVSKSSIPAAMSADDARRIFLGVQRTFNDQAVTVLFQRVGAAREEFNTKVLGKTGSELTSYMVARIFTGRSVPPTEVEGDEGVKRALANNPAAIGYVSDGAVDDSVKVLLRY
jgi:hypothetical protein